MAEDLKSLTKKERKEYAKKLQQTGGVGGRIKKNLTTIVILAIILVIIGGVAFVYTRPPRPKVEIGQSIASQGATHIDQGSTEHPPYNSNPPTSGPHWPTPAECKIYTQELPDEAVIHSLEHGAGWITYKSKDDKQLVDSLTAFVESNPSKTILSPRSSNDSAIAVATWGRLLKLEEFDDQQITDFLSSYKNNAPEPLGSC